MVRFPGGILYEPDDLNFNARLIAAATTVQGNRMPGLSALGFDFVELFATKDAGASTTVAVDILPSVDGVNVLGAGITPISALTMGAGGTGYGFFDFTNALSVGGITVAAGSRFAWFQPWFRIDLRNPDGVNSATFTLRLVLGRRNELAR